MYMHSTSTDRTCRRTNERTARIVTARIKRKDDIDEDNHDGYDDRRQNALLVHGGYIYVDVPMQRATGTAGSQPSV